MKASADKYFVASNQRGRKIVISEMWMLEDFAVRFTIEEKDLTLDAALILGEEIARELMYRLELSKEQKARAEEQLRIANNE
ncbi:MAG: hypothetical protein WAV48_04515 [Candidatus Magasanikiibacteriota bacterium]